jgi:CCR4-NOT transcription complex subunit 7/8
VEVRPVWRHNFAQEAALIESLLPRFRYAAVDTEYPGTVHRPVGPAYLLTAGKRYALLKANVDELDLIQPGITLFNDDSDPAASITWEFNLREFDPLRHRHAPESVAMLRARGVDFHRTRRHGVHAAALGARLRKWLRAGLGRAVVVTFSGGYDLAYLVKTMYGL